MQTFRRKRLPNILIATVMLFTILVMPSFLMVQQASAASCSDPDVWFSRARWCGFFKNKFDEFGDNVRVGGVPAGVNTTTELINLIEGDLASSNANHKTGAQFIVLTMIGRGAGAPKSVTAAQLADFESRLKTYGDISENGTTSTGSNGSINWHALYHWPCGTKNTFYQDDEDDVAPYIETATNGDCEDSSHLDDHIFFRNKAGAIIYVIRRLCMNPLGDIGPLSNTPPPNFNLTPTISSTVNGTASTTAEPGDSVAFTYTVNNSGTTPSVNTACNTYANTYAGYHAAATPAVAGGPAGPSPGCPRNFAVGTTTVTTETVPITVGNQTICRSLFVNPATYGGTQKGKEICVTVANKPYLKVFGGDISVGNGIPAACTSNTNAAVMAWNKEAAGGYAGAGTQFAAFALKTITDFATAQGNAGGAPVPTGLSFANTATNVATGNFGGNYGSVPCIADYYARKPAATSPLPANVSAMVTGAYAATGTTTINGGNVNPGNKISVYINGDVYINSDITYAGNWAANQIPLFELVVRGNIYIGSGVHRLDGVYISQKNGAAGGTIYTCATSAAPIALANGAFFNSCNSKLTVNGAFIANSVEFLRTAASIGLSNVSETSNANGAGTNAAEVFNFNPTLWMVQPNDSSGVVDNYDAITSLPPVL